jgi:hypothetical protein
LCSADLAGTAETCNGIDDDCDGRTDVGVRPEDGTCAGLGICGDHAGAATCTDGRWFCAYEDDPRWAGPDTPETTCDAFDNDCDGVADEALLGAALAVGIPLELQVFAPRGRGAFARRAGEVWFFGRQNNRWRAWLFDGIGPRFRGGSALDGRADLMAPDTVPRAAYVADRDAFVVLFEPSDISLPPTLVEYQPSSGQWLLLRWQSPPAARTGGALLALDVGGANELFVVGGRGLDGASPPPERIVIAASDGAVGTAVASVVQSHLLPALPDVVDASAVAADDGAGGRWHAIVGTPRIAGGAGAAGVAWRIHQGQVVQVVTLGGPEIPLPGRPALTLDPTAADPRLVAWTATARVAWSLVGGAEAHAIAEPSSHRGELCAEDAFSSTGTHDAPIIAGRCVDTGHDGLWTPDGGRTPLAQPTGEGELLRLVPTGLAWVAADRIAFWRDDAWHVVTTAPIPWAASPEGLTIAGGPEGFVVAALTGGNPTLAIPTIEPPGWDLATPAAIDDTFALASALVPLGFPSDGWWVIAGRDADGKAATRIMRRTSDDWTTVGPLLEGAFVAGILTPGENVGYLLLERDGPQLHRIETDGDPVAVVEVGPVAWALPQGPDLHLTIAAPGADALFFAHGPEGWLRIDGLQTFPEPVEPASSSVSAVLWLDGIGPTALIAEPSWQLEPLVLSCEAPLP